MRAMATNGDGAVGRDQTSDLQLLVDSARSLIDMGRPDGYLVLQSNMAQVRRAAAKGFAGLEAESVHSSRGCRRNRGKCARL